MKSSIQGSTQLENKRRWSRVYRLAMTLSWLQISVLLGSRAQCLSQSLIRQGWERGLFLLTNGSPQPTTRSAKQEALTKCLLGDWTHGREIRHRNVKAAVTNQSRDSHSSLLDCKHHVLPSRELIHTPVCQMANATFCPAKSWFTLHSVGPQTPCSAQPWAGKVELCWLVTMSFLVMWVRLVNHHCFLHFEWAMRFVWSYAYPESVISSFGGHTASKKNRCTSLSGDPSPKTTFPYFLG